MAGAVPRQLSAADHPLFPFVVARISGHQRRSVVLVLGSTGWLATFQSGAEATAVQTLRDGHASLKPRAASGLRAVHRRFSSGLAGTMQ